MPELEAEGMGKKRVGERTCIGCGGKAHKTELLRFVARNNGTLDFDEKQQEKGRGGYIHPNGRCFQMACKKKRLSLRFRREINTDLFSIQEVVPDGLLVRDESSQTVRKDRAVKTRNP
jgi:predicted RNA-binding protein YlxR (DUF448 family)